MGTKNVGTVDKWIRFYVGLALVISPMFFDYDWRWLGLIGIVPMLSAVTEFCPLYKLLKISTRKCCGDGMCERQP